MYDGRASARTPAGISVKNLKNHPISVDLCMLGVGDSTFQAID